MLNCTLAGVNTVGMALGSANGSALLANTFAPQQGAVATTGIAMDVTRYAATTRAEIHFNDVRAMATGVVCGHGEGVNCTENPGAKDCAPPSPPPPIRV